MKQKFFYGIVFLISLQFAQAQSLPEVELNQEWKDKIRSLAPKKPTFPTSSKKKNILVFSLFTGFEHWVIPHTEEMVKILGDKSGAFQVSASTDIREFEAKNLKKYDAIVLNNTCSKPDHRNLFWDKLRAESDADSVSLMKKAQEFEANLLNYVKKGGGLLLLHGAVTTQNNSWDFSRLVGASFDYHPPQQAIQVRLADPEHPLVQAFPAEGFNHVDEPYFYKNAYGELNFHPLLYFNNSEISQQRKNQNLTEGKTYVAWIRAEGKGRVMYSSPSHNAQSFENPDLLRFFLDGMQYVVGDVACDESPIK
ncbi:ThuA domain-containing protein [Algoriphagus sp. CAU 1675]|uniref:ThuA domain-containing protein n=1 Tax=Algoriphagus sp. CAU 1675 TaxID=3032597 RepID=UPI0023D9C0C4|nr:ThuA domain-containing protein [Algoriphagus sp. CAU 1675]MDF2157681.1 ThuA domain-containing protein [Algoriphagus sp. CAU 1675]